MLFIHSLSISIALINMWSRLMQGGSCMMDDQAEGVGGGSMEDLAYLFNSFFLVRIEWIL